ncbi:hypothetical protein AB1Y20_017230 [Prymnesium parvum]|uniref:uridine/cytidine kinase n=1 Tax=Prymnesium parvum TaxID=97485 RepID=A0AB34IB36_PRYPA
MGCEMLRGCVCGALAYAAASALLRRWRRRRRALQLALRPPSLPLPGSLSAARPRALGGMACGGVIVIGIAGGSASGKSYYCKQLLEACSAMCWCAALSHDMYYKDRAQVDRECGGDWDCPEALHTHELVEHLDKLAARETVDVPYYDFATSSRDRKRKMTLTPPPCGKLMVVLVEGLMVFHSEALRARCHFRVFVDCDEDTRFMRRLARDTGEERDRSVASVYHAWAAVVKPAHHKYVEPTKRYAHLVVPSTRVHADVAHLHRRKSLFPPDMLHGNSSAQQALEEDMLTEMPSLRMMCAYVMQCQAEYGGTESDAD